MSSAFPGTVSACIRTVLDLYQMFLSPQHDDFIEYMKNVGRHTRSPNYISEENLVILTTCRDRIQKDWNTLAPELQGAYSTIPPSVDGLVSRMQLLVLFQKLKDWC
jgi:hypothetical protein